MQKVFIKWVQRAALFMAVAFIGASTGLAQVSVELTELVGRPGDTGMVAVNIADVEGGPAIKSWGFDVVTDGNVTFTGIVGAGTLTDDAGFNYGSFGNRVGANSQLTDIETSGTLIYLTFDLNATGAGVITLTNFEFNDGVPAWVGAPAPPTGDYVVSDRMMLVQDETVHEDEVFTVSVIIEDALVEVDDVNSFAVDVSYDPDVFTIDGVITAGTMTENFNVNGVHVGGEDSGLYRVSGFNQDVLNPLSGAGVFFQLSTVAGNKPGLEGPGLSVTKLTFVEFNEGTPLYGAFPGDILVLPFNVSNEDNPETPAEFVLDGNYPNPFNPTTNIKFDLPEAATVSVQIMDMLGREVMSVPAQNLGAGANQTIQITAGSLTSGLYLYRVVAQSQSKTDVKVGTMTLLK